VSNIAVHCTHRRHEESAVMRRQARVNSHEPSLGSVNPIRTTATGADFSEGAKRGVANVETF